MSAASPLETASDRPWTLDTRAAEFHFQSDDALRSGVALARTQSWVADYRVDDARRTLWVRFSTGDPERAPLH